MNIYSVEMWRDLAAQHLGCAANELSVVPQVFNGKLAPDENFECGDGALYLLLSASLYMPDGRAHFFLGEINYCREIVYGSDVPHLTFPFFFDRFKINGTKTSQCQFNLLRFSRK